MLVLYGREWLVHVNGRVSSREERIMGNREDIDKMNCREAAEDTVVPKVLYDWSSIDLALPYLKVLRHKSRGHNLA